MPCVTHSFDPSLGPIVKVAVFPAGELQELDGKKAVSLAVYDFLIDTGSVITGISQNVVDDLGLDPLPEKGQLHGTAGIVNDVPGYLIDLAIPLFYPDGTPSFIYRHSNHVAPVVTVLADMKRSGIEKYNGIMGLDIITAGHFTLNVSGGYYTLCI